MNGIYPLYVNYCDIIFRFSPVAEWDLMERRCIWPCSPSDRPSRPCQVLTGGPAGPTPAARRSGVIRQANRRLPPTWTALTAISAVVLLSLSPRKTSGAVNHAKSLDNMTPSVSRDQDKSSAYISLRRKQSRAASSPGVSVSPLPRDGEKIVSANRGEVYSRGC